MDSCYGNNYVKGHKKAQEPSKQKYNKITNLCKFPMSHGSLNVPIEHHPTIGYMVYNGYYKVMSNIPKMGHLPIPVSCMFQVFSCHVYRIRIPHLGLQTPSSARQELPGPSWVNWTIPSGKLSNYGKIHHLQWVNPPSMLIFNSYVRHHQRVVHRKPVDIGPRPACNRKMVQPKV